MKFKLFTLAFLALLTASCTQDIIIPEPTEKEEETVIINATIPETRVTYDDSDTPGSGGTLAWEETDQLLLVGFDGTTYKGTANFTWTGTGNQFSGTAVPGATTYKAYYPAAAVTLDANGNLQPFADDFWQQEQIGNNTKTHLRNKLLLFDEVANLIDQPFTLTFKSSIIRFKLSNIPSDLGAPKKIIWTVETVTGGATRSAILDIKEYTHTSGAELTAYLAFDPAVMTNVDASGEFKISLIGDKSYEWSTTSSGKNYAAGNRYKATVSGDWTQIWTEFKFTINLTSATTYKLYQKSAAPIPANLDIDWGDGDITTINKDATPGTNFASHYYNSVGTRTITIKSDQADPSEKQMPQITFYSLNPGVGNLLTAVLTPFPNMGATDFKECFYKCDQLTSIAKDLFRYNTQATTFYRCFYECKQLTSVPEDLFKYNTQATNFYNCFHSCWELVLIKGIFPDPSENDDFFVGRTMNFERCFYNVGYYTTAGTAPELWMFTGGGGTTGQTTWTTYQCFKGANLTNPDIPTSWK